MDRNRFVQLRKSAIIIQQILRFLIRGRKRLQNKLGSMCIHWKLLLLIFLILDCEHVEHCQQWQIVNIIYHIILLTTLALPKRWVSNNVWFHRLCYLMVPTNLLDCPKALFLPKRYAARASVNQSCTQNYKQKQGSTLPFPVKQNVLLLGSLLCGV